MKSYYRVMLGRKLRCALMAVPAVSFYRYEVSFKLVKSS